MNTEPELNNAYFERAYRLNKQAEAEEHARRVNLMIHGAFDSPIYAVWDIDERERKEK